MNDTELITLVREPFDGVRMTMPLDAVVDHGRVLRRRRRRRGLTGAVALAHGLATAVALLVPGGHAGPVRPGPPATAVLAAWTVARDPDGGITVTFNQMKDPGGLQAALRADGIPARVTFDPLKQMTQPLPAGCTAPKMSDPANAQLQDKILSPPAIWAYQQLQAKLGQERPRPTGSGSWSSCPARCRNCRTTRKTTPLAVPPSTSTRRPSRLASACRSAWT